MNNHSHPRQWRLAIVSVLTSIIILSFGVQGLAQSSTVIASDLTTNPPVNLINYDNPWRDAFGIGDAFQIMAIGTDEPADGIPFSLVDDSAGVFVGDTLGIVDSAIDFAPFFGATDTVNNVTSDPVTATWTFDISGATDLVLNVDVAAMGDFEANDSFVWSIAIDGGAPVTLSAVADESISTDYTLASGTLVTLNDPMTLNGTLLTNVFQTFTIPIAQTGSELELSFTAQTDGGSEAFAFRNVIIEGVTGGDSGTPDVRINEIRIDQPGDDNDEYAELFATAGTSLDGLTYLVIGDGSASAGSGVIEAVVDLSGQTVPASGFFTLAESTFTIGTADLTNALNFENSDNVTHLLVSDFTGANGDDLDTDDDGVLDSTPWTEILDSVGLVETPGSGELLYSNTLVGPDGSFVPGHVFRCPDGDGAWQIGAFGIENDTPGEANDCPDVEPDVIVSINEIRIDQSGADNDEYAELFAPAGTSLDGLTYLVIGDGSGGSGVIEAVVDLSGQTVPASGFFTLAESTFTIGTADLIATLNFENSDNVTHLLVSDFTGANGDDLDTDDDGVLDSTPWTSILDSVGLVQTLSGGELLYSDTLVGPDGSFVPAHVFRCPDGDGAWQIGAFGIENDTPGEANDCGGDDPGDPGDPQIVFIHQIQGSGDSVAITTPVIVEAVVIGDYSADDQLDGFFIQEEDADADGDTATSEGIFVYCGNNNCGSFPTVSVGDTVRITGTPNEFFNMSQLNASTVEVLSSGNPLPAPTTISLPITASDLNAFYEQYEGMLVSYQNTLVVSEYFQLARYGEIILYGDARPYQFTDENAPDVAGYSAHVEALARNRVILDDDDNTQNSPLPDGVLYHPQPNGFGVGTQGVDFFRGGDTVTNLTGVLHWSFAGQSGTDAWRIRPVPDAFPITFNPTNPRQASPAPVGGNVTVATLNVLNYFTSIDGGDCSANPANQCRGADSETELARQTQQTVNALATMNADVVGLVEIENNGTAVSALVDALNAQVGAGTYAYINTGVIGTDAIAVAVIYKPAVVTPVGTTAVLDDPAFVDPLGYGVPRSRPAVAQTFEVTDSNNPDFGGTFTVVVNHLKSKGASGCSGADCDQNDGAGAFNATRTAGADYLVNTWLPTNPTGVDNTNVLILGDLNAYANETPITTLESAGYSDLLEIATGGTGYTYVFDGQLGYLDYIMASSALTSQVTGTSAWNVNSDEVSVFDYNDTIVDSGEASFEAKPSGNELFAGDGYRNSDHDPLIVGLDLDVPVTTGTLEIVKVVDWNGAPINQSQTFEICVNGLELDQPLCNIFDFDGGSATLTDLPIGVYTVAETDPGAMWTVSGEGAYSVLEDTTSTVTITNVHVAPTPEPTDEPTPDPTDEPTPDPTDEPTPDPTDTPTPDPTDEPTPDPTDEPTPDPTDTPSCEITHFELWNADSDSFVSLLTDGATIDLASVGNANFTIVAVTNPTSVGSVAFNLTGEMAYVDNENVSPYSIFGDNENGDYDGRRLALGSYTLYANAYTEAYSNGILCDAEQISFTVIDSTPVATEEPTPVPTAEPTPAPSAVEVTGFLLVNAETDTIIGPLVDGDVIDTDALGTRTLNIIGIADGAGSMVFTGSFPRNENAAPFTVGGDTDGVDFWPVTFDNGAYTVTATSYTEAYNNGIASTPVTITFTVIGNNE